MTKPEDRWAYERAIALVVQDTQNLWQLFATFFVPQSVLLIGALQNPSGVLDLFGLRMAPVYAVGDFRTAHLYSKPNHPCPFKSHLSVTDKTGSRA